MNLFNATADLTPGWVAIKKQFRAKGLEVLPVGASVPVTLADHHAVVARLLAGTGFGFTTFLAGTA